MVFAALEEVRGVRALCPKWLPADLQPTSIFVNNALEYAVELQAPAELFPHVVLQFTQSDPPGTRVREATVGDTSATIYFEPSRQAAGLHSGHYIVAFPGTANQRGSYWVSVHQESRRSEQWNVERALKIARSLRPTR